MSRSQVLRTPPGWRWAFTAGAAFFTAGLIWNVTRWVQGELDWTLLTMIGVPLLAVIAVGTAVGAVAAWTHRVWVDSRSRSSGAAPYDRNELHQATAFGDSAYSLDAPGAVRISYTAPTPGSTVTGTWKVKVSPPSGRGLTVSTPWVPSIRSVLEVLHPALARNAELGADHYTRRALASPGESLTPPQLDDRA
ncbi:MAG: hypothetical protein JWO76_1266 [Nocardioides sp.]|nr:hypothetical protein [Nocardioides sp.]